MAPASVPPSPLPRILVTGASGFVGSHFLQAVKDDYYIYALGRRKQHASGVAPQENIQWLLGDLGEKATVERITGHIAAEGGLDYLFHFAWDTTPGSSKDQDKR